MSLPAYPADGQLVAVAGEEIVCPKCGTGLVAVTADWYGLGGAWLSEGRELTGGLIDQEGVIVCRCGGMPSQATGLANERGVIFAENARSLLLRVRSGTWTGWRSIGAE